jgi:serine protease Do
MKSRKVTLLVVFAVFVGVVVGLILSSNLNITSKSIAADENTALPVILGAQADVQDSPEMASAISFSKAFAQVAKSVKSSIVTIKSTQTVRNEVPDFWQQFFNVPEEQVRQGLGSGVIVNSDGYIITNNHVVEGADELQVTIGKDEYDAEIVGRDPESDLAVIKIDANDLYAIKLGDSEALEVGEWVLAIGNPFSALLDQTVTAGIVSAKGRKNLTRGEIPFENFIQTDAAINPGNSGGALVNLRGELVGINTMIYSGSGGSVGIGFAIPINLAKNVMQQLINSGKVARGWLGVSIGALDEDMAEALGLDEPKGALVNDVTNGSPADDAGLQESDVILNVGGHSIADYNELVNVVANYPPGETVKVTVWRDSKERIFEVELGERPASESLAQEEAEKLENALGIKVDALTPENMRRFEVEYEDEKGVLVTGVKQGSVAAKENIRPGDLVISVNRKAVESVTDFNNLTQDLEPNKVVLLRMKRGRSSFYAALRVPKNEE